MRRNVAMAFLLLALSVSLIGCESQSMKCIDGVVHKDIAPIFGDIVWVVDLDHEGVPCQ